jgi:hypothetical protein
MNVLKCIEAALKDTFDIEIEVVTEKHIPTTTDNPTSSLIIWRWKDKIMERSQTKTKGGTNV